MRTLRSLTRLTLLTAAGLTLLGLSLGGAMAPLRTHAQPACTISWIAAIPAGGTTPALDGTWSDTTHWDQGRIPGPTDHACITLPGDYMIVGGNDTHVGSLTLDTPSGTATLAVGMAFLTVDGDIYNAERIIPGSGTKYYYPGGFIGSLIVGGTVINHGRIEPPSGVYDANFQASLVNEADGVISGIGGGVGFNKSTATFINRGLITTSGGGVSFAGGSFTQEGGTIQIETEGAFNFANGTFTYNGGSLTGWPAQLNTARLVIAPGATPPAQGFRLYGATTLGCNIPVGYKLDFIGSTLTLDSSRANYGTLLLSSLAVTTNAYTFTNAPSGVIDVLIGSTFKGTFVNQGTLNLHANLTTSETSTYTNTGSIAIFPGASLNISGATPVFNQDGGTLVNSGSFALTNGTFNYSGGEISGIEPVLTNAHLTIGPGAGGGRFVQTGASSTLSGDLRAGQGLLIRDGTLTLSADVNNTGAIETGGASGATLVINGGMLTNAAQGTFTTGTTGGGTRITGNLLNRGALSIGDSAGLTYTSPGSTFTNIGTITVPTSKTLTIASGTLSLAGGRVSGGGTVKINQGAVLTGVGPVAASVINAGTLSPGAPIGQLSIDGSYTQQASGALDLDLSGSGNGAEIDQLAISGQATLGGTLNVRMVPGFLAAVGDQLPVISYATLANGSNFSTFKATGSTITSLERVLSAQGLSLRVVSSTGTPGPSWLVLLYLAGDDVAPSASGMGSLSPAVTDLLTRLKAMPYNPAMRLVVLYDGAKVGDSRIYVRESSGLQDITETAAGSPLWLGGMGGAAGVRELNTGSVTTLSNFISWARTTYPGSAHTMLSIVDHGGGWAPDLDKPAQPRNGGRVMAGGWRGLSLDMTSGSSLATRNLSAALRDQGRIDVLFLDACLMGMIENAYEVRAYADYLVAGENLLFAELPYENYLAKGGLTDTTTPHDLALRIVDRYNYGTSAAFNPFTMAALDLRQLRDDVTDNLAASVDTLAEHLLAALPTAPSADDPLVLALTQIYSQSQKFDYDSSLSIDPHEGYVDLVDFAQRLRDSTDPAVPSAAREAAAAVAYTATESSTPVVVSSRAVSGTYNAQSWSFAGAHGISIFLPLGEQDYRPTLANPQNPALPAGAERQLTYYADRSQLAFSDGVAQWAALLVRLESAVPIIRTGPGGLPTAAANLAAAPIIDTRAFNPPAPLIIDLHSKVYLPLIRR